MPINTVMINGYRVSFNWNLRLTGIYPPDITPDEIHQWMAAVENALAAHMDKNMLKIQTDEITGIFLPRPHGQVNVEQMWSKDEEA